MDLEEFLEENGCIFKTLVVWGFGDPLLNYQLPIILNNVKNVLENYNCGVKLVLRTPAVNGNAEWVRPAIDLVDSIIIPFSTPPSFWREVVDPDPSFNIISYIENLKKLSGRSREKMWIELVLFRTIGFTNAEDRVLGELASILWRIRVDKIYLKTLDRPSHSTRIKPVHGNLYRVVYDKLVEQGFRVVSCIENAGVDVVIHNSGLRLYNHILRKPLNTLEIIKLYGDDGLKYMSVLDKRGCLDKILWEGNVYYKIRCSSI